MRYRRLLVALVLLPAGALAAAWAGTALTRTAPGTARELRRAAALDARLEAFRRLEEEKERLVAKVVAGRLGLREAGREVAGLAAAFDDGYDDVLAPPVLPQSEEALCRNVILWAERALRDDPGRAATLRRLEGEFRREFPAAGGPAAPAYGPPAAGRGYW